MKIGDIVKSKRTGKLYKVVERKESEAQYVCEPVKWEDSRYLFFDSDVKVVNEKSDMPIEFCIKLSFYFEIKNAELYGGKDSVGYASSGIEIFHVDYERDNLFNKKELMEKYIDDQTKAMAAMTKVPIENVRVISKEEYEINTEDK